MFHDTSFWVAASFIIFVFAIYKPVAKFIAEGLDKRRDKIKNDLDEAKQIKESAQELLTSYQKKHKQIIEEEAKFIENAKSQAKAMIRDESLKVDEDINRKIKYAKIRIENMKEASQQKVRDKILEISLLASKNIILDTYDEGLLESDIKKTTQELERIYK